MSCLDQRKAYLLTIPVIWVLLAPLLPNFLLPLVWSWCCGNTLLLDIPWLYQAYPHFHMLGGEQLRRSWHPTSHHHRKLTASLQVRSRLSEEKGPEAGIVELVTGVTGFVRRGQDDEAAHWRMWPGNQTKGNSSKGGKNEWLEIFIFFLSEPFILASELKSCLWSS